MPGKDRKGVCKVLKDCWKSKPILRQIAGIPSLYFPLALSCTTLTASHSAGPFSTSASLTGWQSHLNLHNFNTFVHIIHTTTCDMDTYAQGPDLTVTPLDVERITHESTFRKVETSYVCELAKDGLNFQWSFNTFE
jgi:hypothetical protein